MELRLKKKNTYREVRKYVEKCFLFFLRFNDLINLYILSISIKFYCTFAIESLQNMHFLKKLHSVIDGNIENNKISKHYNIFSSTLIIISILLIILESFKELEEHLSGIIYTTETVVVIFFSFEYILRLITSPYQYPNNKISAPLLFIVSFLGVIDLLSILPFYLPMFVSTNLTFLRVLRLFRLMRIFKLLRYSESVRTLGKALSRIKTELISTLFITFIVLLFSANIMYIVENKAQPDAFKNMGESLWWAVATLTTVGYGDIYPVTSLGKVISGIMALIGIGIVAIPAGLLSSAFVSEIEDRKRKKTGQKKKCPHCEKFIE